MPPNPSTLEPRRLAHQSSKCSVPTRHRYVILRLGVERCSGPRIGRCMAASRSRNHRRHRQSLRYAAASHRPVGRTLLGRGRVVAVFDQHRRAFACPAQAATPTRHGVEGTVGGALAWRAGAPLFDRDARRGVAATVPHAIGVISARNGGGLERPLGRLIWPGGFLRYLSSEMLVKI